MQCAQEGGFCGRTNKLVDSCYAYWVGALFPLIHNAMVDLGMQFDGDEFVYDQRALQRYVTVIAQCDGGFRDKPGFSSRFRFFFDFSSKANHEITITCATR
jgi:protein farnesyltransferase subunit beta